MKEVTPLRSAAGFAGEQVALPDGFELIRPLGRGQMARVYLAREIELGRTVAVKVLRSELTADEAARARFEREARSAASLTHPNVVAVYRFGYLADRTPYLVMTHVEGRSLAERLQAGGPLPETRAREVLVEIASALAAAHRKGIVHRDLRPANVLIDEASGRALLADFGLAAVFAGEDRVSGRFAGTGQFLGDPRHSSPEQLRGEYVTGQADLFSLAVLAYEILTGEGPFEARSDRELIAAHLTGTPRPLSELLPGASPELEELLLRCLVKEPGHRPTAEEVVERLSEQARAGLPLDVRPMGGPGVLQRRFPRFVGAAVAAGVGLVGLVGTLVELEYLPRGFMPQALNLTAWGVVASSVMSWYHGDKGVQRPPPVEIAVLMVLAAGWVATAVFLFSGSG
jgi:serine/threonine-protein kinase